MKVYKEIKRYLDDSGISQTFVAEKAGINLVALNMSLNGNRRLTADEYISICKALNLEPNFFSNGKAS